MRTRGLISQLSCRLLCLGSRCSASRSNHQLVKLGLLNSTSEYALQSGALARAFQLCQASHCTHRHLALQIHILIAISALQVAFAWAASIEPEEGTQLLLKLGLLDPAIEYALESGAFAQAFQLCQAPAAQHKMPDCHLKYAMYLEDEGGDRLSWHNWPHLYMSVCLHDRLLLNK